MAKNTLLGFLCLSFAIVSAAPSERKKVLILGAGAAGITAAKTLHDKGVTDFLVLAPVVQKLDSAIHRINHYPMDKY